MLLTNLEVGVEALGGFATKLKKIIAKKEK